MHGHTLTISRTVHFRFLSLDRGPSPLSWALVGVAVAVVGVWGVWVGVGACGTVTGVPGILLLESETSHVMSHDHQGDVWKHFTVRMVSVLPWQLTQRHLTVGAGVKPLREPWEPALGTGK